MVTKTMKEYFPGDFLKRFPGKKSIHQHRTAQNSIGPYREISSDGHEKNSLSGLRMGSIGLSFYGYKDKWTADILSLIVAPECRTAAVGGHIFLDFIGHVCCKCNIFLSISAYMHSAKNYRHSNSAHNG